MRNIIICFFLFLFFAGQFSVAQNNQDYIGSGHTIGVKVTTSSNYQSADGFNSINGSGLMPDLKSRSRFLAQATMGVDYETINTVSQTGFSQWLDQQFNKGGYDFLTHLDDTLTVAGYNQYIADGGIPDDFGTSGFYRLVWWESIMTGDDLLRDRISLALSEIFVVSM